MKIGMPREDAIEKADDIIQEVLQGEWMEELANIQIDLNDFKGQ